MTRLSPQVQRGRYFRLNTDAARKGFTLLQSVDGTWVLKVTKTGAIANPPGTGRTLDQIAKFLMTQKMR